MSLKSFKVLFENLSLIATAIGLNLEKGTQTCFEALCDLKKFDCVTNQSCFWNLKLSCSFVCQDGNGPQFEGLIKLPRTQLYSRSFEVCE